jgi:hypothetical protein
MVYMNTSAINLHLAAARTADIERASRRRGVVDFDAESSRRERRARVGGRRRHRVARVDRPLGG